MQNKQNSCAYLHGMSVTDPVEGYRGCTNRPNDDSLFSCVCVIVYSFFKMTHTLLYLFLHVQIWGQLLGLLFVRTILQGKNGHWSLVSLHYFLLIKLKTSCGFPVVALYQVLSQYASTLIVSYIYDLIHCFLRLCLQMMSINLLIV